MKRLFATVTAILCAGNSTRAEVRYNRDILPILAGNALANVMRNSREAYQPVDLGSFAEEQG